MGEMNNGYTNVGFAGSEFSPEGWFEDLTRLPKERNITASKVSIRL